MTEVFVFAGRLDRALAASAVTGLFLLGIGEIVARLDEPLPLLFWLPTLWGGAALILVGGFVIDENIRLAKVLITAGCLVGVVPTMWTLVMPALLVTLVFRTLNGRSSVKELSGEP
ncbi:MAG: hypothetical protein ACRDXF_12485 [Acidimicrobiia bacterium]